ncbi:tripartite motif-containing protein 16 [Salmo salar]|uniref:Tripartite motif-containing protein 16 n=1 Tax=Salmo salar TaxID=8030 RepID=A0ABM3DCL9_SALSA|nr:tripartite motif-containing protein 16-like [Salmo salar]
MVRCAERTTLCRALRSAAVWLPSQAVMRPDRETLSWNSSHTQRITSISSRVISLSSPSVSSDLPSIVVCPLQYFRAVSKSVSELREKLEDLLKGEWTNISTTVKTVDVLLPPEPKTREQFLKYSCQLTLDTNTAHKHLILSEENRKVTYTRQPHPYPDHPERFTGCSQVLCREGLSGRCYWEVERSVQYVHTAVSYKDVIRGSAKDSLFWLNEKSWSLNCTSNDYSFYHNTVMTKVLGPLSSSVGVYLNHKAGILPFYSVSSDTMTLLHRAKTTFTQPLYPGIMLWRTTAELCKLW